MPKTRIPTPLMLLNGSAEKNPARLRARSAEPVDDRALGPAPTWFSADQVAAWAELASCATWAAAADRVVMEMAAVLLSDFRRTGAATPAALILRLESLLARIGLSPADRSKVSASPPAAPNPFHRFKVGADGMTPR